MLAHYHPQECEVKEESGGRGLSSQLGMPHRLQLQVSEACFCCIICSTACWKTRVGYLSD